ncbi:exonuclease SbcCD subunit D [Uliginosibacterium paludis]|uniref:Nuclease SbcCD subunit D n=1 Tax=Uliginosibacterium paludis TaxID=1615952 RepID=A0ABV2CKV9_9RHOO
MRFLHTADWHLGRIFNARSLLEDQRHLLDQLVGLVAQRKPDAVLIAGDVFDRAVPPPEAVALLSEVLSRIVIGLRTPVLMIAGNHDSGERLGFGAPLLAAGGLHLAGPAGQVATLRLADAHGPVDVIGLPYAEPAEVRALHALDDTPDHAESMRLQLDALRARPDKAARTVLVGHAFVMGGEGCDSERPLSVGGSGAIGAEVFAGFDYVALGHLHRPQTFAGGRVHYSGSLMKYSLSEVDQAKSVSLVELDGNGAVSIERIALEPLRALRILEGSLEDLLQRGAQDPRKEDYIHARLTDAGALLDPMSRLREVWPNALSIERLVLSQRGEGLTRRASTRQLAPAELFASFLREVADEDLDEARRAAFAEVLQTLGGERGAA